MACMPSCSRQLVIRNFTTKSHGGTIPNTLFSFICELLEGGDLAIAGDFHHGRLRTESAEPHIRGVTCGKLSCAFHP